MGIMEIEKKDRQIQPGVPAGFPFESSLMMISQLENKSFFHHWHPEIEFTVIEKGEIDYQANDRIFHLREGDGIFVNSNVLHSGWLTGEGDCIYRPVNIGLALLQDFEGSDIDVKFIAPVFESPDFPSLYLDKDNEKHREILGLLRDCINLRHSKSPYYQLLIKAKLYMLWALMCEEVNIARRDQATCAPAVRINEIKAALSFMRENYRYHITLDNITHSTRTFRLRSYPEGLEPSWLLFHND